MSMAKSESLLRRDARTYCNKRHQRTIWESRRDERRTNQQLERELRLLERSRSYRERELDRDQLKFLNSFVDIFQKQCDIVAARKAKADEITAASWKEDEADGGFDDEESQSQSGHRYEDYMEIPESMTNTTSEHAMAEAASGAIQEKTDEAQENGVTQANKRKLRLQRDSVLPIIYSPCSSGFTSPVISRPNSPRPSPFSPTNPDKNSDQRVESGNCRDKPSSPDASSGSPRHSSPRQSHLQRNSQPTVSAAIYQRRLSPLSRYKIPESHFRADSPSSKNSTIFVNDVPDLGESICERVITRPKPLPPPKRRSGNATEGDKKRQDPRGLRNSGAGDRDTRLEQENIKMKFMLEFDDASTGMDPYATGADIENIRKQFLVNTLAKKLKISALRSGHFAELDDIRKKIERRRKCVEELLLAKRKNAAKQAAPKSPDEGNED